MVVAVSCVELNPGEGSSPSSAVSFVLLVCVALLCCWRGGGGHKKSSGRFQQEPKRTAIGHSNKPKQLPEHHANIVALAWDIIDAPTARS